MALQRLVSILLLAVFLLEPLAGFCWIAARDMPSAPGVDVVCSCQCCGEVCPMGADCCCGAPKSVKRGISLEKNGCQPGENAPVEEPVSLHRINMVLPIVESSLLIQEHSTLAVIANAAPIETLPLDQPTPPPQAA